MVLMHRRYCAGLVLCWSQHIFSTAFCEGVISIVAVASKVQFLQRLTCSKEIWHDSHGQLKHSQNQFSVGTRDLKCCSGKEGLWVRWLRKHVPPGNVWSSLLVLIPASSFFVSTFLSSFPFFCLPSQRQCICLCIYVKLIGLILMTALDYDMKECS